MTSQDALPVSVGEFGDSENDIKAFYDSIESSDATSLSHVSQECTWPSEKTMEAFHSLQDLLSTKISILSDPRLFILMQYTLNYLLTLPQNEGLSMAAKSEIQKLRRCFEQWSLEYHNASGLSATAEAELSKPDKVMNDLEANVEVFQKMDKAEKFLCNHFGNLQEEKRKLEDKIKMINVQIADSTKWRDKLAKRKIELFNKAKVLKADRDNVTICVPKLKAEQEFAQRTKEIIEEEWIQLGEQFIRTACFKEYWFL